MPLKDDALDIGIIPATDAERRFQELQLKVILSRKQKLDGGWPPNLCSPFWRIYVNKQSGAFVKVGEKRMALRPTHLYLIPAWLPFQTRLVRPVIQNYIHFDFSGFPAGLHRLHFKRVFSLPLNGVLEQLHSRLDQALNQEATWLQFSKSYALVYHAMTVSLSRFSEGQSCFQWTERSTPFKIALDRIKLNQSIPPSNGDLAGMCNMSTSHFIKKFEQALGMTPAQYVNDRRIATAAQWLTSTDRNIKDISESLGFSDRSHFSKVFKQRLGSSPAAYRTIHLNPS